MRGWDFTYGIIPFVITSVMLGMRRGGYARGETGGRGCDRIRDFTSFLNLDKILQSASERHAVKTITIGCP